MVQIWVFFQLYMKWIYFISSKLRTAKQSRKKKSKKKQRQQQKEHHYFSNPVMFVNKYISISGKK